MKKFTFHAPTIAIIVLLVMSISCNDNAEESIAPAHAQSSATTDVSSKGGTTSGRVEGYSFDGTEGDPIPFETASAWIANYQEKHPDATRAHFFGHEIISELLAESGAIGIRIYYALNDEGVPQLILIGTAADGTDIVPGVALQEGSGQTADASYPCPPFCPK